MSRKLRYNLTYGEAYTMVKFGDVDVIPKHNCKMRYDDAIVYYNMKFKKYFNKKSP